MTTDDLGHNGAAEINVRNLRSTDRQDWQRLYYSYLEFYQSEPIATSTDLLWNRLTQAKPEIRSFVVEDGGRVVGLVHFHFQLSTWTHTWHCYLEDLYVDAGSRGKGFASALIHAVKTSALENKCSELFWITRESNETARRLYDKVATASDFVRYEILLDENLEH
jgi:ribosomal protein S18 acetylase RimI-like enzyme